MPICKVKQIIPADEIPQWIAFQAIQPVGWEAQNRAQASICAHVAGLMHGENIPYHNFLIPDLDWREFSPDHFHEIQEEKDLEAAENQARQLDYVFRKYSDTTAVSP